jgi:crotonobetainyl-CoA:carnitine CoA-transferase CaiB-like acyl-CoA transferase
MGPQASDPPWKVLAGCRVVDHSEFITGPYTAMLLADMGADVIKVERPGRGDPFRSFEEGLYGPQFQAFNRNKKSVQLDLERADGRALMGQLLDAADVYVQNFRPGVVERWDLGAGAVMRRNPRLVHCSISGFGADGPYAGRPAYDTVGQALSGFLSMFVAPDAPRIVGPATADSVTGLYAACGILGALLARHATGRGRRVEVAMTSAMAHFAIEQYHRYFVTGVVPNTTDRGRVSQSFAFACADGLLLAIHLSSPVKFWEGFLRAVEASELARDPRFTGRMDRVRNHEALEAALRPLFAQRPRAEWLRRLAAEDVPHAPILDLREALADPQMRHLDVERHLVHPTEGPVRTLRSPIAFDGQRQDDIAPPPALNEHGDAIRAWLAGRAGD